MNDVPVYETLVRTWMEGRHLLALIERLAPQRCPRESELGDCVWCRAPLAGWVEGMPRDWFQTPDAHRDGCPWAEARRLLDG
jgi:hypothetical protein